MELEKRITALEEKIDKLYSSVEKVRKYFLWTGIITLLVIIVPLMLMHFVFKSAMQGLTGAGIEGL